MVVDGLSHNQKCTQKTLTKIYNNLCKKAQKFKMLQKVKNKIKKGFEKEGNEMKSRKTENPQRKRSYVCKCIAHVSALFLPKRSKVKFHILVINIVGKGGGGNFI